MTDPANYWKPSEDKVLIKLHGEGLSQSECGRRMKRSQSAVREHGMKMGLSWDRSMMKAAIAAIVVDNRARRSALESRLLDEATDILDKLHKPAIVYSITKDGYVEKEIPLPTSSAVRDYMNAATMAVDRSLKIAVHDNDSSHDDAKSMLTSLASAMGMAFREGEAVL